MTMAHRVKIQLEHIPSFVTTLTKMPRSNSIQHFENDAELGVDNCDAENSETFCRSNGLFSEECFGVKYDGFLKVGEQAYMVSLAVPVSLGSGEGSLGSLCLAGARLQCEWPLRQLVGSKAAVIEQRLKLAESVEAFLKELKLIAESCALNNGSKFSGLNAWSLGGQNLFEEVLEVKDARLNGLAEDMTSVTFEVTDSGNRQHCIKIILQNHASSPPVCVTDLPQAFDLTWTHNTRLCHIVQQFESCISSYQALWDSLAALDSRCWILEPPQPRFSHTHRRIALGSNLSILIKVNVEQPTSFPDCRFLGPEAAIAELKDKLNENLHRWDEDRTLLNNLEEVLECDFPTPADTSISELSCECGICYCLHLDTGESPTEVCEEPRCGQAFHHSCLYEWLQQLSSRTSINTMFGDCPLCGHAIKIKIPKS